MGPTLTKPEVRALILDCLRNERSRADGPWQYEVLYGALVLCQTLILGYSDFNFRRASSRRNCQSTPRCVAFTT